MVFLLGWDLGTGLWVKWCVQMHWSICKIRCSWTGVSLSKCHRFLSLRPEEENAPTCGFQCRDRVGWDDNEGGTWWHQFLPMSNAQVIPALPQSRCRLHSLLHPVTWSDTNKLLFHVAPPGKFTSVCQKHGSVSGLHWDLPKQDSDPCCVTLGILLQTLLPAVAVGIHVISFYCLSVL